MQQKCVIALCRWSRYSVLFTCSQALGYQPTNAKALYRRGVARKFLMLYRDALADLVRGCSVIPTVLMENLCSCVFVAVV